MPPLKEKQSECSSTNEQRKANLPQRYAGSKIPLQASHTSNIQPAHPISVRQSLPTSLTLASAKIPNTSKSFEFRSVSAGEAHSRLGFTSLPLAPNPLTGLASPAKSSGTLNSSGPEKCDSPPLMLPQTPSATNWLKGGGTPDMQSTLRSRPAENLDTRSSPLRSLPMLSRDSELPAELSQSHGTALMSGDSQVTGPASSTNARSSLVTRSHDIRPSAIPQAPAGPSSRVNSTTRIYSGPLRNSTSWPSSASCSPDPTSGSADPAVDNAGLQTQPSPTPQDNSGAGVMPCGTPAAIPGAGIGSCLRSSLSDVSDNAGLKAHLSPAPQDNSGAGIVPSATPAATAGTGIGSCLRSSLSGVSDNAGLTTHPSPAPQDNTAADMGNSHLTPAGHAGEYSPSALKGVLDKLTTTPGTPLPLPFGLCRSPAEDHPAGAVSSPDDNSQASNCTIGMTIRAAHGKAAGPARSPALASEHTPISSACSGSRQQGSYGPGGTVSFNLTTPSTGEPAISSDTPLSEFREDRLALYPNPVSLDFVPNLGSCIPTEVPLPYSPSPGKIPHSLTNETSLTLPKASLFPQEATSSSEPTPIRRISLPMVSTPKSPKSPVPAKFRDIDPKYMQDRVQDAAAAHKVPAHSQASPTRSNITVPKSPAYSHASPTHPSMMGPRSPIHSFQSPSVASSSHSPSGSQMSPSNSQRSPRRQWDIPPITVAGKLKSAFNPVWSHLPAEAQVETDSLGVPVGQDASMVLGSPGAYFQLEQQLKEADESEDSEVDSPDAYDLDMELESDTIPTFRVARTLHAAPSAETQDAYTPRLLETYTDRNGDGALPLLSVGAEAGKDGLQEASLVGSDAGDGDGMLNDSSVVDGFLVGSPLKTGSLEAELGLAALDGGAISMGINLDASSSASIESRYPTAVDESLDDAEVAGRLFSLSVPEAGTSDLPTVFDEEELVEAELAEAEGEGESESEQQGSPVEGLLEPVQDPSFCFVETCNMHVASSEPLVVDEGQSLSPLAKTASVETSLAAWQSDAGISAVIQTPEAKQDHHDVSESPDNDMVIIGESATPDDTLNGSDTVPADAASPMDTLIDNATRSHVVAHVVPASGAPPLSPCCSATTAGSVCFAPAAAADKPTHIKKVVFKLEQDALCVHHHMPSSRPLRSSLKTRSQFEDMTGESSGPCSPISGPTPSTDFACTTPTETEPSVPRSGRGSRRRIFKAIRAAFVVCIVLGYVLAFGPRLQQLFQWAAAQTASSLVQLPPDVAYSVRSSLQQVQQVYMGSRADMLHARYQEAAGQAWNAAAEKLALVQATFAGRESFLSPGTTGTVVASIQEAVANTIAQVQEDGLPRVLQSWATAITAPTAFAWLRDGYKAVVDGLSGSHAVVSEVETAASLPLVFFSPLSGCPSGFLPFNGVQAAFSSFDRQVKAAPLGVQNDPLRLVTFLPGLMPCCAGLCMGLSARLAPSMPGMLGTIIDAPLDMALSLVQEAHAAADVAAAPVPTQQILSPVGDQVTSSVEQHIVTQIEEQALFAAATAASSVSTEVPADQVAASTGSSSVLMVLLLFGVPMALVAMLRIRRAKLAAAQAASEATAPASARRLAINTPAAKSSASSSAAGFGFRSPGMLTTPDMSWAQADKAHAPAESPSRTGVSDWQTPAMLKSVARTSGASGFLRSSIKTPATQYFTPRVTPDTFTVRKSEIHTPGGRKVAEPSPELTPRTSVLQSVAQTPPVSGDSFTIKRVMRSAAKSHTPDQE